MLLNYITETVLEITLFVTTVLGLRNKRDQRLCDRNKETITPKMGQGREKKESRINNGNVILNKYIISNATE